MRGWVSFCGSIPTIGLNMYSADCGDGFEGVDGGWKAAPCAWSSCIFV